MTSTLLLLVLGILLAIGAAYMVELVMRGMQGVGAGL
jgi:hypothetical protein